MEKVFLIQNRLGNYFITKSQQENTDILAEFNNPEELKIQINQMSVFCSVKQNNIRINNSEYTLQQAIKAFNL